MKKIQVKFSLGETMRLRRRQIIFNPTKGEKETTYMEKIAYKAIAYVASLASDDENLSSELLVKLIKTIIENNPKEILNG